MAPETLNTGLIVGIAYKLFCMAADSMPPPGQEANYYKRWAYDFAQKVASNTAKVGASTPFPLSQAQPLPPAVPVQEVPLVQEVLPSVEIPKEKKG